MENTEQRNYKTCQIFLRIGKDVLLALVKKYKYARVAQSVECHPVH